MNDFLRNQKNMYLSTSLSYNLIYNRHNFFLFLKRRNGNLNMNILYHLPAYSQIHSSTSLLHIFSNKSIIHDCNTLKIYISYTRYT